MYILVNTFARRTADNSVGAIVSRHKTREAAEKADARLQRGVKRGNGQSSYLPTVIVDMEDDSYGKHEAYNGHVYRA